MPHPAQSSALKASSSHRRSVRFRNWLLNFLRIPADIRQFLYFLLSIYRGVLSSVRQSVPHVPAVALVSAFVMYPQQGERNKVLLRLLGGVKVG